MGTLYARDWQEPDAECRITVKIAAATQGVRVDGVPIEVAAGFFHGGKLKPNGADVRVHVYGKLVPCVILQNGPGDFVRVGFPLEIATESADIYFGGKLFNDKPHVPTGGLLLETRVITSGGCANWAEMQAMVKASKTSFGADYVPTVFQGGNLFGPSDRYISLYSGLLIAPETGEYQIVTSSDDASFVQIDGNVVVEWPGYHGAIGNASHLAKLNLSKGAHPFRYTHANTGGEGMAVAAWKTPSGEKPVPLPESAFCMAAVGSPEVLETKAGALNAGFYVTFAGEAFDNNGTVYPKLHFHAYDAAHCKDAVQWDFGDGLTGSGPEATHIYLASDTIVTVRMRRTPAGGAPQDAENKVRVSENWRMQTNRSVDKLSDYAADVATYNLDALTPLDALVRGADLFRDGENSKEEMRFLAAYFKRVDDTKEKLTDLKDRAIRLSLLMRNNSQDYDGAIALLRRVEALSLKEPPHRADLVKEIGDIFYYYKHDLDAALQEYDKVVGRYPSLNDNIVRVTKLRIGDIYLDKGDGVKARANYTEADQFKVYGEPKVTPPVRLGNLIDSTEYYMHEKKWSDAQEWLNTWEWEFPLARIDGQSSYVHCRLTYAQEQYYETIKYGERLAKANPGSRWSGQCLFWVGMAYEALKKPAEAKAVYARIVKDFADSPSAEPAQKKLEGMK
ncbi:MAG TPA: tetratricopeptide repeat protein [Planctomycetota bacterium]|nr:tetratricopeptide repeat protein [Planctomycetota bacterium]